MAKKNTVASKTEATLILEKENIFVFQINRPVTETEFEMIKDRLEKQQEKNIKIILVPYSVTLKEDNK